MISLYAGGMQLRSQEPEEEVDPMSSVANIADAMLVFACGLMIALVVAWEVDLSNVKEVELENSEQVEDVQSLQDILSADGSSYIQRGTVYQDPKTGTMYLLEEGSDDGSGSSSGGGSAGEDTGSGGGSADAASPQESG